MKYTKGDFQMMIEDWQADHADEYADLIIEEPKEDGGKWVASAHDDNTDYQLSDDGTGNIVINYIGAR
jgi:hypothetical protein